MATAITTTASTLEGQFLEVTTALMLKQRDETSNPDGTNIISNLNLDYDTLEGQVAATFPFTLSMSANGEPVPTITELYDVA